MKRQTNALYWWGIVILLFFIFCLAVCLCWQGVELLAQQQSIHGLNDRAGQLADNQQYFLAIEKQHLTKTKLIAETGNNLQQRIEVLEAKVDKCCPDKCR